MKKIQIFNDTFMGTMRLTYGIPYWITYSIEYTIIGKKKLRSGWYFKWITIFINKH